MTAAPLTLRGDDRQYFIEQALVAVYEAEHACQTAFGWAGAKPTRRMARHLLSLEGCMDAAWDNLEILKISRGWENVVPQAQRTIFAARGALYEAQIIIMLARQRRARRKARIAKRAALRIAA